MIEKGLVPYLQCTSMKGCSRVYHADDSTIWNDCTISHSRRVKVGRGSSVFQYAGGPSTHCTQHAAFMIPDSHIPQEVLYDQIFPIQEPAEPKKAPPKRYTNSAGRVLHSLFVDAE